VDTKHQGLCAAPGKTNHYTHPKLPMFSFDYENEDDDEDD